ncbi:large subunit ribosomal protein L13e [Microbotryum lychnidis-dioicae p1A1 Lamole]|uniref:Large subunit ribosomal protein L13e n=1 Tax=Microbotryum lychnidis-dioicae (strain p1A1 Lamole / MvSl-1064) TaxID=683840 RepID=U5HG07_USTV1|nr:large subunit ribosomal protein L13e [Microbotryum lychnidis-dioicae p1A1 Lamole]|eukprot:KDE03516.1 large subunit ribosomal protein L13e [Microbotryum lychnidis-dioicae p1A1 Lamole]
MGFAHNNVLPRNHFRKDWQSNVKTGLGQPGRKHSRRVARQAKAVKAGLRPVEQLRPAVRCPTKRYNTKLRSGRGFTAAELKAAGIRRKEALSIGIPVDHRRRNRSEESLKINKERLEAYRQRLVVFPKKAGKVKKGDTEGADKSVEGLKTLAATFPLPAGHKQEGPRAITSEELANKGTAYTALRKARSDQRYAGIRAERQKKKEEEEAAKKK